MSAFFKYFRKTTEEKSEENELKGYKVTNVDRTRKFGVACRNLEELKRKACAKFNIPSEEQHGLTICLVDGSQIDEEYFLTVEPQTTLILQRKGEKLFSDADLLYNTLRQVNLEFITAGDAASKFLTENLKSKIAVLNKALNKDDTKTALSSRGEHPEWFENLDTTANTKEAYMHRRCQDRIRCYLYKTIDQIKSSEAYLSNEKSSRHLTNVLNFFKLQLREDHYLGFYFDRSHAKVSKKHDILSLEPEEEEDKEHKVKQDKDESDHSNSTRCYDHCACRIPLESASRSSGEFLDQFFANDDSDCRNTIDELDARKLRSNFATEAKGDDDARDDDLLPFKIKRDDALHRFSLCNSSGEFNCDGIWNAARCAYGDRHRINPYRSYEELVLFSTWNFDHRIERSRTLIPKLIKASEEDKIKRKDVRYFYDNIFTVKNLRLVHIICHDKGAHKQ